MLYENRFLHAQYNRRCKTSSQMINRLSLNGPVGRISKPRNWNEKNFPFVSILLISQSNNGLLQEGKMNTNQNINFHERERHKVVI
jgi:hypothetical protein